MEFHCQARDKVKEHFKEESIYETSDIALSVNNLKMKR